MKTRSKCGKVLFKTIRGASLIITKLESQKGHKKMFYYYCDICNGYHLTKQENTNEIFLGIKRRKNLNKDNTAKLEKNLKRSENLSNKELYQQLVYCCPSPTIKNPGRSLQRNRKSILG